MYKRFGLYCAIALTTFSLMSTLSLAALPTTPTEYQDFDSELQAEQAGWNGLNNEGPQVNIGYSPTNHSMGASGPGEAGGTASFSTNDDLFNYYADTTFAPGAQAILTTSGEIHASARFFIGDFDFHEGTGPNIYFGYFNTNDTGAPPENFMGFRFNRNALIEPSLRRCFFAMVQILASAVRRSFSIPMPSIASNFTGLPMATQVCPCVSMMTAAH